MIFRKAMPNEKESIDKLYQSVKGTEFCTWDDYPGMIEIEADMASNNLFVLENDGEIIGTISINSINEYDDCKFWENANAGEFSRVVIKPKYQGKGLSKILITNIFEEFTKRKLAAVHISVAKKNLPAQKLYESMGFKIAGELFMYGNDYYLCEKKI